MMLLAGGLAFLATTIAGAITGWLIVLTAPNFFANATGAKPFVVGGVVRAGCAAAVAVAIGISWPHGSTSAWIGAGVALFLTMAKAVVASQAAGDAHGDGSRGGDAFIGMIASGIVFLSAFMHLG